MNKQYTIKEVADLLGVSTNKIRFYEKKGLIQPERDAINDYRYFSEEEIVKLQSILLYRGVGLSVKAIEELTKETSKVNQLTHFYNQWQVVNDQIHALGMVQKALEKVMDEMYLATDGYQGIERLKHIQECVSIIEVKNSWKDKWAFDNWAKDYDEDVAADRGSLKIYQYYEKLLDTVVQQVVERKNKETKVIDIGTGTGNLAQRLIGKGYEVTGIDQSRAMLDRAKAKNPTLKVRLGSFMKLPLENKTVDAIVSTYAFHHLTVEEKILAVEDMIRVLQDDGILVIGDMMFADEVAKQAVYDTLTTEEKEMIEDEYYTDISELEQLVKQYGMQLDKIQIDRFCWVVCLYR